MLQRCGACLVGVGMARLASQNQGSIGAMYVAASSSKAACRGAEPCRRGKYAGAGPSPPCCKAEAHASRRPPASAPKRPLTQTRARRSSATPPRSGCSLRSGRCCTRWGLSSMSLTRWRPSSRTSALGPSARCGARAGRGGAGRGAWGGAGRVRRRQRPSAGPGVGVETAGGSLRRRQALLWRRTARRSGRLCRLAQALLAAAPGPPAVRLPRCPPSVLQGADSQVRPGQGAAAEPDSVHSGQRQVGARGSRRLPDACRPPWAGGMPAFRRTSARPSARAPALQPAASGHPGGRPRERPAAGSTWRRITRTDPAPDPAPPPQPEDAAVPAVPAGGDRRGGFVGGAVPHAAGPGLVG